MRERDREREIKGDREKDREGERGGQDNSWMQSVGEMIVDRSSTRM